MTTPSDPAELVVPLRLQLFLARAGVASRRGSEDLMTAGRVTVNGQVVTALGTKVDPAADVVAVDGAVVGIAGGGPVYYALNKPVGFITTMSDPHGRPTVAQFVDPLAVPGLFPIGRLDQDTSGLLLFTTNGDLSHRLLHPRWKVWKTYAVSVAGTVTPHELSTLRTGVELDDGLTSPAEVEIERCGGGRTYMTIKIREGKKRQVRRMCSAVGHRVLTLHRTDFGPVSLGDLPVGSVRPLTDREVGALHLAVELERR